MVFAAVRTQFSRRYTHVFIDRAAINSSRDKPVSPDASEKKPLVPRVADHTLKRFSLFFSFSFFTISMRVFSEINKYQ